MTRRALVSMRIAGVLVGSLFALGSGCQEEIPHDLETIDSEALRKSAAAAVERTRQLAERAPSFDQAAALAALPPHARNGEYLRLDDRLDRVSVEETPAAADKDACVGCVVFEFEGNDPVPLVSLEDAARIEDGRLVVDHRKRYVLLANEGLEIERDAIGEIEVRIRLEQGNKFHLGWSKNRLESWPKFPESKRLGVGHITVDAVPGGAFHTYRVNAKTAFSRRLAPGDSIRSFLVRASNLSKDRVEIDYIRFVPKLQHYAKRPVGRSYEELAGETRPVLYTLTPTRLSYELRVPAKQPRFVFGMGGLRSGSPIRFRVDVTRGEERWSIFDETLSPAKDENWHDRVVDLSAWAGQDATLHLQSTSPKSNVAFWSSPLVAGAPSERFNVVLLLEDTLRADRLSLYGYERPTSPNKQRFAAEGVVFEHAFSQATKTRPSCPSFMTSLYPSANGVGRFDEQLDDRFATLAEVLRSQGFRTGAFIQNGNAGPAAGLHQGFERVSRVRGADAFGDPPLDWVEQQQGKNFFLYLHALNPHGPFAPAPPYDEWYQSRPEGGEVLEVDRRRFDPEGIDAPTAEGRSRRYDGEIRQNDTLFATLLERLEALGELEHTLFIAISDHGEFLGEHGIWGHEPPGYAQVIRIPLFMVLPGTLPKGVRVTQPVQLVDLMPTVLELAGIDASGLLLQGDSLLSLVKGAESAFWKERMLFSEEAFLYQRGKNDAEVSASAIYRDLHVLHSFEREGFELYDYVDDGGEEREIRDRSMRQRVEQIVVPALHEMKAANLEIWRGVTGGGLPVVDFDLEAQEELRALGYIE